MTTRERYDSASPDVDRLLTAWFDAEARVREPDDLLERTLARSSRARPLPAWLLPERWLPMELTMRRARLPRATPYVVLLILVALLATVAVAIVGQAPRVPAPFGLAANGSIAYVDQGRVTTLDPSTGDKRTVFDGRGAARYPTFSRDGSRLAFVSRVDTFDGLTDVVVAVDATGQGLVRLTEEPLTHPGLLTWSPDGSTLAFEDGGKLWLAATDGSGAQSFDLGVALADELAWRPPDGRELIFRGVRDGRAGLFLVGVDGAEPKPITPLDGGTFDYLWTTWSPDGQRVAYHIERSHEIEVLMIGESTPTVFDGATLDVPGLMFPRFSPDGTRLASMIYDGSGPPQIGVFPVDDPSPAVTLTGPQFTQGIQFDWSPDGSEILAVEWGTDQAWILDPEGGPGQEADWSISIPDWVEWQRLAK